ncbi:MAG: hypothetical protein J6X91_09550 [Bacteroidales bacterium]|nr:hypothetical protein [Bacteroidales bacterium]
MTQKEFKEKWEHGLTSFLKKKDISRVGGYTRKNNKGQEAKHDYIIDLKEGENELDIIKKYNLIYDDKIIYEDNGNLERLIGKIHSYARHLNSSQIMCYNFFRRMMTVDSQKPLGHANDILTTFIKEKLHLEISKKAICHFEYEDDEMQDHFKSLVNYGRGEKSQFDFYIKDEETEIFFEIKYTESSFGKWTNSNKISQQSINNHCTYVEKGYKEMLKRSPFFTQGCKDFYTAMSEDSFSKPNNPFNKHYQLFRNALKADNSKYSVFIFPKANPNTNKEFESFRKNLVNNNEHIIALFWEDLTSYMSTEFIEKYISFMISPKTYRPNNQREQ